MLCILYKVQSPTLPIYVQIIHFTSSVATDAQSDNSMKASQCSTVYTTGMEGGQCML